jgi:hypothetical protein
MSHIPVRPALPRLTMLRASKRALDLWAKAAELEQDFTGYN